MEFAGMMCSCCRTLLVFSCYTACLDFFAACMWNIYDLTPEKRLLLEHNSLSRDAHNSPEAGLFCGTTTHSH